MPTEELIPAIEVVGNGERAMTEVEKLAKAQREAIERKRNAVETAIAFAILALLLFGIWKLLKFCWSKSPRGTLIGIAIVIIALVLLIAMKQNPPNSSP